MTAEEFKNTWEHSLEIRVAWGDMDSLGHVNNTVYFRYFEFGRIELTRDLQSLMPFTPDGIGPILAYIDCRFLIPLTYPDTILVGTQIRSIGNTSVKISQSIYSLNRQQVAAGGESVLVVVNYATGEKLRVPDSVRERYRHLG